VAKILVAESDRVARNVLCQFLQKDGHEVQCAATLTEALQSADACKPEILIVDTDLPDGSGGELIEQLRQTIPSIRVVLLSGLYPDETEAEGRRLKADLVFDKPFSFRAVRNAVRVLS